MPSPQKGKRKHLANRKFPRKQTPWNSHRPTPDGAVTRPNGTTNITSLHRTLKKKKLKINIVYVWPKLSAMQKGGCHGALMSILNALLFDEGCVVLMLSNRE